MSRSASICAIAALAALATGCATTSESSARMATSPAASERTLDQDHAYMQQVEQIAMRRGIGVTWVNPPTKRKARSTN